MSEIYYRQCTLKKGPTVQVAWIPEQFAKKGKYLRIGDDNGWLVVEAGTRRISGQYLMEHEREYLNHRNVTDV
jgi:hypothetical protein